MGRLYTKRKILHHDLSVMVKLIATHTTMYYTYCSYINKPLVVIFFVIFLQLF